ncbi:MULTISPECIES: nickel-responsive transcriptional regulator NikR [unclassified Methanopyrus]|uniref:nickel-responsive transcriptional regulator NikR n=1 Tax=unclassified Methanopyrus TaxID=2684913 RepID=UPI0012FBDD02|nr:MULTISPECIES: nickel-responsive transcriptional regulator NikR [unclassified Methanopyrus]
MSKGEDNLVRTSITIPNNLLQKVNELIASGYFASRSEIFRQALREYLQRIEWTERLGDEEYFGVLTYVFHHERAEPELVKVQHEFTDLIISTTHIHVSHEKCLEVLLLQGPGKRIAELAKRIRGVRGVEQAKLTVVSSEGE